MKNKKIFVVVIALAVSALVLYYISQHKNKKVHRVASMADAGEGAVFINPKIITEGPGAFPLQKGSKGKAVQMLQVLIGAKPDGIWGAATEAEMLKNFKENSITKLEFAALISADYNNIKDFPLITGTKNNYVRALQIIYNRKVDGIFSINTTPKRYPAVTVPNYNLFINQFLNT